MRQRHKTNFSKLNSNGVTFQRESSYYNILERYARLLELQLKFYKYERKDPEVMKTIENRQSGSIEYDETTGMTTHVISDCYYGCGCAPCGCHEDWNEYKILEKELKHPKYSGSCTNLDEVLKEMDKSFLYCRVVN